MLFRSKLAGALLASATLVGANIPAHASPYLITIEEVGANVVVTGSGQIDLTGVTEINGGPFSSAVAGFIEPSVGQISIGGAVGQSIDSYEPFFSGMASFGSGGTVDASNNTGSLVHFQPNGANPLIPGFLDVPAGYVSNSPLADSTSTYDNATFVSLGITPGTYTWTWGTGADQRFTIEVVAPAATPLPATLPLFATGLGGLGLLGWRRKRKAQAAAA